MKRQIVSSTTYKIVDMLMDQFIIHIQKSDDIYKSFYDSVDAVNELLNVSGRYVTQDNIEDFADEIDEEYGFDIFDLI